MFLASIYRRREHRLLMLACALILTVGFGDSHTALGFPQTESGQGPYFNNPSFEEGTRSWNVGDGNISAISNVGVDGNRALRISHGATSKTTGFSQVIQAAQAAQTFTISLAAKVEQGQGELELLVRFDRDTAADVVKNFAINDYKEWQTFRIDFRIPAGTGVSRLYIRSENTVGNTLIDHVQIKARSKNLLGNRGFESPNLWTLGNAASYSTTKSLFGARSLRLTGGLAEGDCSASQIVNGLTDKPTFTLSAHILAEDVVSLTSGGVGFEADCLSSTGRRIRTLYFPMLAGATDEFAYREFSFLVPQGTRGLEVRAMMKDSIGTAYVDNIRLEANEVPDDLYHIGCGAGSIDPPDYGTSVVVSDFPSFQDAVDAVRNSGSAAGKVLWVPRGRYTLTNVIIQEGTHLKMHKDARMIRQSDGGIGFVSAFFRTPTDNLRESNVILEGGHFDFNSRSGQVVNWRGDRWVVRNMYIPAWTVPSAIARAMTWYGNDAYIYQNTVKGAGGPENPVQESFGGIVMAGGARAHIMGNDIYSGDDAIGLFTTSTPFRGNIDEPIPSFDRDIRQVEIYNNILNTSGGRAFACGLPVPRADVALTAEVTSVRVRNATGICGGKNQLLTIQCTPGKVTGTESETGTDSARLPQVRNIHCEKLDLIGDFSRPSRSKGWQDVPWNRNFKTIGVFVYSDDDGQLQNIRMRNIKVKNMTGPALFVRSDSTETSRSLNIKNSVFDGRLTEKVCNPLNQNECQDQASHVFIARAIRRMEVNHVDAVSQGNKFHGTGSQCWDQDKDGRCDSSVRQLEAPEPLERVAIKK